MIGKTRTHGGFRGTVYYCLQEKKNPEILELNGLSNTKPRGLYKEFEAIRNENQNISKPVWHSILSFKEDNITNDKMVEIANRLMEKAGFSKENNQFVFIKHNDREHLHCHIIANRVGFNGRAVNDFYCKSKTVQWAKQLENEFGLIKVQDLAQRNRIEKTLSKTNDQTKEHLKETITKILRQPEIKTLSNLAQNLLLQGIDMQILRHAKTGLEYGVSFSKDGKIYKGSDIGKQFAFKSLSSNLSPTLKMAKTVVKLISKGLTQGL